VQVSAEIMLSVVALCVLVLKAITPCHSFNHCNCCLLTDSDYCCPCCCPSLTFSASMRYMRAALKTL